MRFPRITRLGVVVAAISIVAFACSKSDGPTGPSGPTNVRFHIASPFCSGAFTYQFSIDEHSVGSEFLQHNDFSKYYGVSAGSHHIVTTISGTSYLRDTTVTVAENTTYTDQVQVFCQ